MTYGSGDSDDVMMRWEGEKEEEWGDRSSGGKDRLTPKETDRYRKIKLSHFLYLEKEGEE